MLEGLLGGGNAGKKPEEGEREVHAAWSKERRSEVQLLSSVAGGRAAPSDVPGG